MTFKASDPTVRINSTPLPTVQNSDSTRNPENLPFFTGFRYQVKSLIAEGGMGKVYRAFDTHLKRDVALKIHQDTTYESDSRIRFSEEAMITGQLQHPGIPPIYDLGNLPNGQPYIAMKLIEGHTLEALVRSDRKGLNIPALFESICQAIGFAHVNRVIHRDLKPANVMVGAFGEVQLMDWGLAKHLDLPGSQLTDTPIPRRILKGQQALQTLDGTILGTPAYMSPEQASGNTAFVDERSDVFGLGGILCFMMTGQPPLPYSESDITQLTDIYHHLEATYLRLDQCGGDPELIALAKRCMSLDALQRPANGYVVSRIVEEIREQATEKARKTLLEKTANDAKRKLWIGSVSVIFTILLLGTSISIWQAIVATKANHETAFHLKRVEDEEQKAKESEEKMALANQDSKNALNAVMAVFTDFDPMMTKKDTATSSKELAKRFVVAGKQLTPEKINDKVMLGSLLNRIGNTLKSMGEIRDSIEFYSKAWDIQAKALGPDHKETLISLNNLAHAYNDLGEVKKAIPLYEQSVDGMKKSQGASHPTTLVCMNYLATGYLSLGQLDQAIPLFELTLEKMIEKKGFEHVDTLIAANNLAETYKTAGQLDKAISLFSQTLNGHRKVSGEYHPLTIGTMNNLALAYQVNMQYDLAQPLFDSAYPLAKDKLGPEHPATMTILSNLAENYKQTGRVHQANALFEQILAFRKAKFGPNNPQTLIGLNNVGTSLRYSGQYQKALPYFQDAYDGFSKGYGAEHPVALAFKLNLAAIRQNLGDTYLAISMAEDVLEKRTVKLGALSHETLMTLEVLSQWYIDVNQSHKIAPLLDRFLDRNRTTSNSNDARWTKFLVLTAGLYNQVGQYSKAETILNECIDIYRKRNQDNWEYQNATSLLGGAFLGQRKYKDAEPLLTMSFESLLKNQDSIPVKSKNVVFHSSQRLTELYRQTNRPELARIIQTKAPREIAAMPVLVKD